MKFPELMTADRRLSILLLLADAPAATCNGYVLHSGLQSMGHVCPADQVATDAAWLAEQGLVTRESLSDHMWVLTLTQRGADVAAGRATVPGVKRRTPGV